MSKHPSKSAYSHTLVLLGMALFAASCGSSVNPGQAEDQGEGEATLYVNAAGSWRALEALSAEEAWLAGATGDWMHVVSGASTSVALMNDSVAEGDSIVEMHFRGIAVTPDAVIGTAIGSPAFIQKAAIQGDGSLALPSKNVWTESDSAAFMDALLRLDDQTLIAMGDPIGGCLCVVRSQDGGASWQRIPCAMEDGQGVPKSEPGEAAFAASNGNLAAAGDTVWMLSGGGASRVYRSTDRGQNWRVFPTPLLQGGTMTGGFSMDFADAFHGIIWGGNWEDKAGQNGRGAVTQDGGATWSLIAEGEGPGYASSVRYRPGSGGQQLALVGSPGGIDLSEDGGNSWRHFSDSAFYAARFSPDGSVLWLSGLDRAARIPCSEMGW